MELTTNEVQAALIKNGSDVVEVAALQSLKIETSPGGEDILDAECPAGKAWSVRIIVEITETDA